MNVLLFAVGLAALNEAIVKYYFKFLLSKKGWPLFWLRWIALATGFVFSFVLAIDFITPLANGFGIEPMAYAGRIVSAILVGSGSNIMNHVLRWAGEEAKSRLGQ